MQFLRPDSRYKVADFDFHLPKGLIAQNPPTHRGDSRLLVVDRARSEIRHTTFSEIAELVPSGDLLVRNTTRVMRARLLGQRESGAPAEIFLLRRVEWPATRSGSRETFTESATDSVAGSVNDPPSQLSHEFFYEAMVHPGSKLKIGRKVTVSDELSVEIVDQTSTGTRIVKLITSLADDEAIATFGHIPLPPYIDRSDSITDSERYQTVYAASTGSVAAPTAGLHFTEEILSSLVSKGVNIADIVLHVGAGTFKPVDVDDPKSHVMHEERYFVSQSEAEKINATKDAERKIWAVGTTSVRTLESLAHINLAAGRSEFMESSGSTDIFIYPPYQFLAVDHLLTNFHLPRSTLLMLVAAFTGYELTMRAYEEAVKEEYRFFSYGDAMLII